MAQPIIYLPSRFYGLTMPTVVKQVEMLAINGELPSKMVFDFSTLQFISLPESSF